MWEHDHSDNYLASAPSTNVWQTNQSWEHDGHIHLALCSLLIYFRISQICHSWERGSKSPARDVCLGFSFTVNTLLWTRPLCMDSYRLSVDLEILCDDKVPIVRIKLQPTAERI